MRFSVVNLGCRVNRAESDTVAALLLAQGATHASTSESDLIIVNTCAVTSEAEKKTRKALRRVLADNLAASVVVTGCAAALNAETFCALSPRVEVIAKGELEKRVCAIASAHRNCTDMYDDTLESPCCTSAHIAALRAQAPFPARVGVKIQDGCNYACTYCIVRVARGKSKSRSADEVCAEVVELAHAGVREIVLTGINLATYYDQVTHLRLAALLERLLNATAIITEGSEYACRFRIASVEPADVDDALIEILATSQGRICRHLHLPLQSGSSKVLAEMGRPYDAEAFLALVARLRKAVPEIALTTDIIAGFPGESDADFKETLNLVEHCGFSRLHVFPYSRRAGTPAAARCDHLPDELIAKRARMLRELGAGLRVADRSRRVGTFELALVEGDGHAMTESYYEVRVPSHLKRGSLVQFSFPEDGGHRS